MNLNKFFIILTWIFLGYSCTGIAKKPNPPKNTINIKQVTPIILDKKQLSLKERLKSSEFIIFDPFVKNSPLKLEFDIWEDIKKISILLPLSTKGLKEITNAIQHGILLSYYQAKKINKSLPQIIFIDTNKKDINKLYDQVVKNKTDIIIGPFLKKNIFKLIKNRKKMPIKTLAINNIIIEGNKPENFYQFSLSPQYTGISVADRAYMAGYENALVLVYNNSWSKRTANAFAQHWRKLGQDIREFKYFDDKSNLKQIVSNLIKVSDNQVKKYRVFWRQKIKEKRKKKQPTLSEEQLAQKKEKEKEFLKSISRRDDIDFLFLISSPKHGRLIKPLLSFYLAKDLKVYSSAKIYDSFINKAKDKDLNGISFPDIPWIFAQTNNNKISYEKIKKYWPARIKKYGRLYAFGIDLYNIVPYIIEGDTARSFSGATGIIDFYFMKESQGNIIRHPVWMKFKQGVPEQIFVIEVKTPIKNKTFTD